MKRKYLLVGITLFLYWLCSSSFLRSNLGSPIRYFSDEFDRSDFFVRGMWLREGKVPYRDTFSEYPQISTYLFGIVHLPFMNETDVITAYGKYSVLFSLLMIYILMTVIILIARELPVERKNMALLLFLPASLYFTYNRFDILPALISIVALMMVKQERWAYAACLLGVGALTKWYPALLVPPIMLYMFYRKESWGKILQFVIIFGVTCLLILLPTFLAGGVRALLSPYVSLENNRGYDHVSFLGLILPFLPFIEPLTLLPLIKRVFLAMQFSAIPLLLLVRINSFEKLLDCSVITISIFMIFAPLYSPQWLLWIIPLMVLTARSKWDISLIVLYGGITYIEFPLIYDSFGAESFPMMIMGWTNIVLLLLIVLQAVRRLQESSEAQIVAHAN